MTPDAESPAPGVSESGALGRQIAGRLEAITLEKVADEGFVNAQANAPWIASGKSILALQGTELADGDAALVIAAGPSLHRHNVAETLNRLTFSGVIVATESSMAWCLRHGIVPDLVVSLDPHPSRIVRWFGDPELNEKALARDDYFSRQDMDPKFREDQLRFNRELLQLIDQHGRSMRIALSSSASNAVVRRAVEAGMDIYWWNPMYDDYDLEGSLTRQIHALNGLPCLLLLRHAVLADAVLQGDPESRGPRASG